MSTLAAPHTGFTRDRTKETQQKPVPLSGFRLLTTYVLLIPLLFFAARGFFSVLNLAANHPQNIAYGATPDAGEGSALHSAQLILVYAIVALVIAANWEPVLTICLRSPLILALPFWAICSTLWSDDPTRTLAFGVLAGLMTLFGVYLGTRFTPRQLMQVFVVTGLVATVGSILLIVALPSAGVDHKNVSFGLQGLYPSKNICAVVTVGFMTVGFLYEFKGKFRSLKRFAYISLHIALILGSAARTGWIVAGFVIVFIVVAKFLRGVRPIERATVAWFLPALTLIAIWLIYTNQADIARLLGKDPTFSGRTNIWAGMFLAIVKRPFLGFGYDAFFIYTNGELQRLSLAVGDRSLSNAENGILQMWLEMGLSGIAVLLVVLFRTCRNAFACFRSDTPDYVIWYMSLLFITLLALVDGDKFMYPNAIEWVMFILADVGLAREAKRLRTSRSTWA